MIDIKNKIDCCGCWACENVCPKQCISMKEDDEGFRYPFVDIDKCIECGLCERVCPELNKVPDSASDQKAFLLQHRDPKILAESTSGGAFTAIAQWVLDRGGLVFGASYDGNFVVRHNSTDSLEGMGQFRNSKYVQSEIRSTFREAKQALDQGRWVLYSGTPCQLEGFLRFLRKPYDRLVTVDVMCHSVTSPKVFRAYVGEQTQKLGATPTNILFRDKKPYGYKYSQMSFVKGDKMLYHAGVETDAYLRSFFSDINVRPSCYHCSFKKQHHLTDFTIWDCFDVYKFGKEFDDDKGVTRLLANSPKALEILNDIKDVARIQEIPLDKAILGVHEMTESVKIPDVAKREKMFKIVMGGGNFMPICFPITLRNRIERCIRVTAIRLGLYSFIKKNAKKVIKDLKRT